MRKVSEMQLKAVNHVKGPAIIIAGPGSGKTFTIIQRILKLILQDHVDPSKILTITFTKAAAQEMQSRYQKETENNLFLKNSTKSAYFGTFHGICYTILKESGLINSFSLVKESDKRKIAENILQNHGVEGAHEYDNISLFLDTVSRRKNLLPIEPPLALTIEEYNSIYLEYEDMLKQQKLLDFDDMILKCLNYLQSNRTFCLKWQKKFDFIQVDEFQDINEIQYRLVRLLASLHNNLLVVGDDDQSIYGFRGSAPGIMRKFSDDYEGCKELYLTENYRSGGRIIELADKVIVQNCDRFFKVPVPMRKDGNIYFCFRETRKEEELQLLKDIKKLSEIQMNNSAVIVRTNIEVFQYMALIKQYGIAVKENRRTGENIMHHFIAEDFKAFLKFCCEGNKRSDFIKIMNKPNLFLSRQALSEETVTRESILAYYGNNHEMSSRIEVLFRHFKAASELTPALAVRYFRKIMGYDEYLMEKEGREDAQKLIETANKIQLCLKEMRCGEKTDAFFERAAKKLDWQKQNSTSMLNGISVITMHGSKGLEFDSVFLPDLNEGVIPGRNSKTPENIEEERRLLYVAITRAQNSLYLYYTRERNRKLTRFLDGIIPHQRQ